ncbi:MAG TPA: hypothetical protein VJ813_05790 [Vicinamibacterales bacterium]|nr:hypothetical protein [Vicinamibacterales bacterium]
MKRTILALGIAAAMVTSTAAVFAAQRGQGPKNKPAGATHVPKIQGGPKAQRPSKAPAPRVHRGSTATATTAPKAKQTRAVGSTGTLSPVQQKLQRNTNLANKLSGRLPAHIDLMTAAAGFRNLGQFVAAVNVSNNLNIPFVTLKSRMVDDGMSLGRAIQDLRPSADFRREARRAEADATALLAAESTTSTSKKAKPRPGGGS